MTTNTKDDIAKVIPLHACKYPIILRNPNIDLFYVHSYKDADPIVLKSINRIITSASLKTMGTVNDLSKLIGAPIFSLYHGPKMSTYDQCSYWEYVLKE